MKLVKTLLSALFICVLSSSCNQKEPASQDGQGGIDIEVIVDGFNGPDTKAAKTGWSDGDVINLWFGTGFTQEPDLKITYSGGRWVGSKMREGATPGEKGKMKAVYESFNDISRFEYSSTTVGFFHAKEFHGISQEPLIVFSSFNEYSWDGQTFKAHIGKWLFLTQVQVTILGLDSSKADQYALGCFDGAGKLYTYKGMAIWPQDGTGVANYGSGYAYTTGCPDTDGVSFYFAQTNKAGSVADYEFSLMDYTSGDPVELKCSKAEKTIPSQPFTSISLNISDFKNPADRELMDIDDDGVVRILAIGNSFSRDAVEQNLYEMFAADGVEAIVGNMYIGGCDLATHISRASNDDAAYSYRKVVKGYRTVTSNVKLSSALLDEPWDCISFQQGAGYHGVYSMIDPDLTTLIQWVKAHTPKPFNIIYHAPWAAAKDCTSGKFGIYNYDQDGMYKSICETTQKVAADHPEFAAVVNAYDAIQNGRTTYLGDTFNSDGWHLSLTYGRFTAACIWYERLTGRDVTKNTFCPVTLTANIANVCRQAAHAAALHPNEITDLSALPDLDPKEKLDTLAAWLFTPTAAKAYTKSWTQSENTALGTLIYSNSPGEVGYINANKAGSGRLSYVQVDKTAWTGSSAKCAHYLLSAGNGGQPVIAGQWEGDYWLFESTGGANLKAGDHVRFTATPYPVSYGARYWRAEYLDGSEWKPLSDYFEASFASSKDPSIKGTAVYNMEMQASTKYAFKCDVILENDTPEWKVRITCASHYQVNGVMYDYPNTKSVHRIAGTPEDDNMPLMVKVITE